MSDQAKIEIPLDLSDVRVIGSSVTRNRELIIEVESTLNTATCRNCGKTVSSFYGYSRPIRLRHDEAKTLKGTLWPFRKRASDLTEEEQRRLAVLFEHSPQLKQAYDLREELSGIFDQARSKAEGQRRIKGWCRKVLKSGLSCYERFLKLLDNRLALIVNYFQHRHSSDFVGGVNNKLKVLKRRCFGITNLGHLFQRITLDFRGYERFSPWQTA